MVFLKVWDYGKFEFGVDTSQWLVGLNFYDADISNYKGIDFYFLCFRFAINSPKWR